MEASIDLIEGIFERLSLKDESFKTYKAATDDDIEYLWESLLTIDDTLNIQDKTKKSICCKSHHYFLNQKMWWSRL